MLLLTRSPTTRWRSFAVVLTLSASILAATAAPAGAVVLSEAGEATVGLQPRNTAEVFDGSLKVAENGTVGENPLPATFKNEAGNAVLHEASTYVIYWDPEARYHGDWREVIDGFMQGVGSERDSRGNVFAVNAQYTDRSNKPAYNRSALKASYEDTEAYPAKECTDPKPLTEYKPFKTKAITCLTDAGMQAGLQRFITVHGLPRGMTSTFYVLTPPGVTVCLDAGGASGHCSDSLAAPSESYNHSFCSYHSDVNTENAATGGPNTLLYAVIPWSAGGRGDGQFAPADQTKAFDCQDGAFDPTSSPIERKETVPTQQEPNQVPCPSTDGYCDRGLADLIVNQIAVEQQNMVTDPLLNAWQDAAKNEASDECRNFFAPAKGSAAENPGSKGGELSNQAIAGHAYYLNTAFNLAALTLNYPGVPCLPGVSLVPQFTAPTPVNAGEVVGFDGMESNITLNAGTAFAANGAPQPTYATYSWDFGDGSPAVSGYAPGAAPCESPWLSSCAASVFHSYQYGGTYSVALTVTDVGGNTATVSHSINVVGPPPPPPPSVLTGGAATGASGPAGAGAAPGATSTTAVTPRVALPVAAATIISRSLRSLRNGVVVRYSVNEQVAGHFEILLDRSTARRLGISGAAAVGLPAGAAPAIVIARAILVTTKAGRSTVKIMLTSRTATRLARMAHLSLTLRLIVRNADAHTPATTTVSSRATLPR